MDEAKLISFSLQTFDSPSILSRKKIEEKYDESNDNFSCADSDDAQQHTDGGRDAC